MTSPEHIERGKVAAEHLLDLFGGLLASAEAGPDGGLLTRLAGEASRADKDLSVANGIGLLFQANEATAGLIGNTLLILSTFPEMRAAVAADPSLIHPVVQEVLRYDSPIQNTRRFLARSGTVAGHEMKEGDGILVVLAAANRDPRANLNPDRFEIRRHDRRLFTFGVGAHACPGEALATTIAVAGVDQLLRAGVEPERFTATLTYRPSANARVPLLGEAPA
jgi:cytochrome P450